MGVMRLYRTIFLAAGLVFWAVTFLAQAGASRGLAAPTPAPVTRPPLLFKEDWKYPPLQGEPDDENTRFSPAALTNPNLEGKLYGAGSSFVRVAQHEGRFDLWSGLATSPVALTLRDKRNYVDLTGPARLRWIVRTSAIHTLYPIVKLATGPLLIGDRAVTTAGEFIAVEVAFGGMRWYTLDPIKVVVLTEVKDPDLSKVDEVGLATLAPGGGHGVAGSANFSTVELFAKPVRR